MINQKSKINAMKNAMKSFFLIALFIIASSFVLALTGPYNYNGKDYYVVTSTDPNLNTGDKVCQAAGKTCVGFTAMTTQVCKYFHPDAAVVSGVDGSKTGFYCNGAPQGGKCARETNTCDICPACNVNGDCGTDISGLYREMYIECSGGQASQTDSETPPSFYSLLNKFLSGDFAKINSNTPSFFKGVLGTNLFQVIITNYAGGYDYYWLKTVDGNVGDAGRGYLISPLPNARILSSQAVIDRIIASPDPSSDARNAMRYGEIRIIFDRPMQNFWLRMGFGALRLRLVPVISPPSPAPAQITDNSGSQTYCNNYQWSASEINCNGPLQAAGKGSGQNCCEANCGADSKCDEQAAGMSISGGRCDQQCKFTTICQIGQSNCNGVCINTMNDNTNCGGCGRTCASGTRCATGTCVIQTPNTGAEVGQYPNYVACEFYQVTPVGYPVKSNHKHVTCAGFGLADAFCVTVMQSQYARAAKCEEQGMIVCTNPCVPPTYQLPIPRCAYEAERPRGTMASPLNFCPGGVSGNLGPGNPAQGKKEPGEICAHGGECRTGNCVGVGMGPPWIYQCSCDPFRFTTGC